MAKEVARHIHMNTRTVVIDVEDDFGVISHHTIPLMGDVCFHCGFQYAKTDGSPDVEASAAAAIAHVDEITDRVISKLEKVADRCPDIKAHVDRAKAKRNGN